MPRLTDDTDFPLDTALTGAEKVVFTEGSSIKKATIDDVATFIATDFAPLAGTPNFTDGINLQGNMVLTSESNPTVNVLQFGEDQASGTIKEMHVTTADHTGTGEGAKMVFNPGQSSGDNQRAASVTIATGRATGDGGGGTAAGGFIRFATSNVDAVGASTANSTTTRWEIGGTGVLQPGGDNLYNIGTAALRPGSLFLATSVRIGSDVATTGSVRIPYNSYIAARNAANTGDVLMAAVTGADVIILGASGQNVHTGGVFKAGGALSHDGLLAPTGDGTVNLGTAALRYGSGFFSSSVRVGGTVAASGAIRLSNASIIAARNAGDSADVQIAQVTAGDVLAIGSGQTFVQVPGLRFGGSTTPSILTGTGTPEGAVSGRIGSLFLRQDGGAGTSVYVKESGTGNTGWVAK